MYLIARQSLYRKDKPSADISLSILGAKFLYHFVELSFLLSRLFEFGGEGIKIINIGCIHLQPCRYLNKQVSYRRIFRSLNPF